MKIARRFNAGKHRARHISPEGTAEAFGVGLELSRPFGTRDPLATDPALKTLGYSRLSLRDSKSVAFHRCPSETACADIQSDSDGLKDEIPCICLARKGVLSSLTGLVSFSRDHPAMNRWAIFGRPCGTWIHGAF